MAQPSLFVILILVIGVTAVSGATDAPNAIATVVSTRCLKPNVAIGLAAVFNFVGLVGMTYISTAVAKTMFGMVDFSGNTDAALYALMAAMIGAILWGIFCWFFGIPCSKSHSLIAGVTGGAIALNGLAGVVPAEWAKVIYGMVFSLVAGFFLGWLFVKVIEKVCTHGNRQAANHALPESKTYAPWLSRFCMALRTARSSCPSPCWALPFPSATQPPIPTGSPCGL